MKEDSIHRFESEGGALELVPKGHDARVAHIAAQLQVNLHDRGVLRNVLYDLRADESLAADYAFRVGVEAVGLLAQHLIVEGTHFQATLFGRVYMDCMQVLRRARLT